MSDISAFLTALYGGALDEEHQVTIFSAPDRRTRQFTDLNAAATYAGEKAHEQNVYVACALCRPVTSGRNEASDATALTALWADIDIKHATAHKKGNLPADDAAGLGILDSLPFPPSIVIHSGHGLQAWWLLREPLRMADAEERARANRLTTGLISYIRERSGFDLDSVGDLARVLRLPGTVNRKDKNKPVPVRILQPEHLNGNLRRYGLDEFMEYVNIDSPADSAPSPSQSPAPVPDGDMADRERRCRAYLAKCKDAISGDHGHDATLHAACLCFRFGLDDGAVLRIMQDFNRTKTGGDPWTEKELAHKIADAKKKVEAAGEFGMRLAATKPAKATANIGAEIDLGQHDPDTGKIVLSKTKTLPTAQAFIEEFYQHPDGRTLVNYAGLPMVWSGNQYREVEDESLRKQLLPWLHEALRYSIGPKGTPFLTAFDANPSTVKAALDTIKTHAHLPVTTTPPAWLDGGAGRPDPRELLCFRSGTLHIPADEVLAPTPALFTTSALNFDYDSDAPHPARWLAFLHELWGDDTESVELVQEWFGYCLTQDTSQEKMLLVVGPRRSGKGTIGRVLTQLIGPANVVGPTTSSLAGLFGLQPLIGKSLAVVSDARFSGEGVAVVTERLLTISGENEITVDRKHIGSVTLMLPTRFVFLTNELPRLAEASGALTGRFMVLRLTQSWYGKEDTRLTDDLLTERPGILLWALAGWRRLRERGRFVEPASSQEAVRQLEDLASPVGAFVRECCVVGPGHRAWCDDLYAAWSEWCKRDGRDFITNQSTFGRDLRAAVSGIARRQNVKWFYEGIDLK